MGPNYVLKWPTAPDQIKHFSAFQVGVAALFYIPRAVWLVMEGGLMKFLTRGVSGKVVEDAARKRETLVKTFQGN
jgi:hypothetical protein